MRILLVLLLGVALPAAGQEYRPRYFQYGKDVVWVPTPDELVTAMLDMAEVTPEDYVIDLGSGDGRFVIAAAKRGTRALGVEYNPDLVELAKRTAEAEGVTAKASFLHGDIFETDFSQATVLAMYLLTSINVKLRPKILEMKPGTRVVSHIFSMEDWEPDQQATVKDRFAYLWIVPAKVAGTWTWKAAPGEAKLNLNQRFQKVTGSLQIEGKELPLQEVELKGDQISFAVGDDPMTMRVYQGRVRGDVMVGSAKTPTEAAVDWSAARRPTRSAQP